MISHNIARKSGRFIYPSLLLIAPICGCTDGQQEAINRVQQVMNADGPATLRYWNEVQSKIKAMMEAEARIDNDVYIFADRDVDSVKTAWAFAALMNAIPTAQVDPELVSATKQLIHLFESITAADLKADRAGNKAIGANVPSSLDFPALARRLNARYNLQFPPPTPPSI
jgi:hypothetical protein